MRSPSSSGRGIPTSFSSVCAGVLGAFALAGSMYAGGQVFVIQHEHLAGVPVFKPTDVELEKRPITARGRQELIAVFAAEQGFARRPLPLGAHGLVLHANGALSPATETYAETLERTGVSAKAGDRVVISNFVIESNRIVFEFNGGPVRKHNILRHISVGGSPYETMPIVQDDGKEPVGSRLTLVFDKYVPEMTGDQLKALIRPVLDFDVKTPVEAYTETLPPKLKKAILDHEVLVGMDRKMVIYAVGQPAQKVREQQDGKQFEEWIYGEAPKPTEFVRFNGNRVTRLEIASVGETPVIRDKDETDGFLADQRQHAVYMGDARQNSSGESAPKSAPSLRLPGEELPQSPMQPVRMPNATSSPKPAPIPPPPAQGGPQLSVPSHTGGGA